MLLTFISAGIECQTVTKSEEPYAVSKLHVNINIIIRTDISPHATTKKCQSVIKIEELCFALKVTKLSVHEFDNNKASKCDQNFVS